MTRVLVVLFLLVLAASGCVRRGTVCIETSHGLGRQDPTWGRQSSLGASVCAEVEAPGEPE